MTEQMDRITRSTRKYMYDDGLFEIASGLILLLVGLGLFSWIAFTDISSVLGIALIAAILILAVSGGLLTKRAVEAVKERLTYPRTGYVAYRQEEPRQSRLVVITTSLLATLVILLLPDNLSRMATMIGALLGIVLAVLGYRLAVTRFYIASFVVVATGLLTSALFDEEFLGAAVILMISGAVLIFSGTAALLSYLKSNPKADEAMS